MKFLIIFLPVFLLGGLMDFITIDKAQEAYNKKEYQKSTTLLKSLKRDTPEYYYDLGNSYYKAGKYDDAITAYKRAKGSGVDEHNRLHNLGNSYFKKKSLNNAILAYRTSLKLKADKDTEYNLKLAKKLLQQKKREQKRKQKSDKNENNKKNNKSKNSKNSSKNGKKSDKKQQKKDGGQNQKSNKKNNNNQNQKGNSKKQKDENKSPNPQPPKAKFDNQKNNSLDRTQDDRNTQQRTDQKASAEVRQARTISEKELKRLMKKMRNRRMPTMMYRATDSKAKNRDNRDINPW